MITENLSTLKIHKLTQAQYDRELAAGRIDENALYLTPDEEIDLSSYATKDDVEEISSLVGGTPISTQISAAINNISADDFGIYVQAQEPTDAVPGDIWIDTINDPTYIPPAIPEITEADNGKVLMVVNGKLQLVSLNLTVDANGVVSM